MPRILIDDGMTFEKTVTPAIANGEASPLKFSFRPPMSDVLMKYEEVSNFPGPDRVEATYKFIADHIVAWDVVDKSDKPVAPTVDNLRKIPGDYIYLMRNEIAVASETFVRIAKN